VSYLKLKALATCKSNTFPKELAHQTQLLLMLYEEKLEGSYSAPFEEGVPASWR
jgi:hypothetical protein